MWDQRVTVHITGASIRQLESFGHLLDACGITLGLLDSCDFRKPGRALGTLGEIFLDRVIAVKVRDPTVTY